jgi:hypothetical protein
MMRIIDSGMRCSAGSCGGATTGMETTTLSPDFMGMTVDVGVRRVSVAPHGN